MNGVRVAVKRLVIKPKLAVRNQRRAVLLHLPASAPWTNLAITGVTRLHALAVPG